MQDHFVTPTSSTPGGGFLLSNGTLCSTDKSKGCRHCSVTSTLTLPQISICCLSSLWSRRPLQTQIPLIGQCCWTRWRLRRGGSSLSDAAEIMSQSFVLTCCLLRPRQTETVVVVVVVVRKAWCEFTWRINGGSREEVEVCVCDLNCVIGAFSHLQSGETCRKLLPTWGRLSDKHHVNAEITLCSHCVTAAWVSVWCLETLWLVWSGPTAHIPAPWSSNLHLSF